MFKRLCPLPRPSIALCRPPGFSDFKKKEKNRRTMRLKVNRYSLQITPEDETDEAYIEEVLGLRKGGDVIHLVRDNAMGLSCIAHLETRTVKQEERRKEPPA